MGIRTLNYMGKVCIIVDSTAGLSNEKLKDNMRMIPLYFLFEEETYRDGIDLTSKQFFEKADKLYKEKKITPTTSQPSLGNCTDLFDEVLKEYDEIVYFTISSGMSGTYQSGVLAAADYDGKVLVFDSKVTTSMLKNMANYASDMAVNGASAQEIVDHMSKVVENHDVVFIVDTLEHLARTGRIGHAAKQLGTLMKLKPILKLTNGEVDTLEKVRTTKKAHARALEIISTWPIDKDTIITVCSGDGMEYALYMKEKIQEMYPDHIIEIDELSPVIGINTGPGTVAVTMTNYHK